MAGWAAAIQAAISLYGDHVSQGHLSAASKRMRRQSQSNPAAFRAPGGSGFFQKNSDGSVQFEGQEDALSGAFRGALGEQGLNMLQGGLFRNQGFQDAFQAGSGDLLGAFGQAQAGQQQFIGNNAFGSLGPAVQGLFGQGFQNLQNAGNTQGLIDQNLQASRALAKPFEDQQRNNFFDSEFGKTLGATTGAGQRGQAFASMQNLTDQQRILSAQAQASQQQQMMSQLGMQQIGQGFQGEGQGFGQMMQSLQQNQSAGQQRLQNAMGMFGMGRDTQQSQFGQGIAAQGAVMNQNQFMQNAMLGLLNADNNRIGAQSGFANALAQLGSNQGAQSGGMFGGLASSIGSMDFGG